MDPRQGFPPELLDEIMDLLKHSKPALLALALGGKALSERARFYYIQQHCAELLLESSEDLSAFSNLAGSPHCTLLRQGYRYLTIRGLDIRKHSLSDSAVRQGCEVFSFLRKTAVADGATIELPYVASGCAPMNFPWDAVSSWTCITGLKLAGTLPSVADLASLLVSLQLLEALELSVEFADTAIPSARGALSPYLTSLSLGPRGFALFSWLALLRRSDLCIEHMVLEVGNDNTTPLEEFVEKHGGETESLTVTLYKDYDVDFLTSLRHFAEVLECEFYLKLTPTGGYSRLIKEIVSRVESVPLENMTIYVPELLGLENIDDLVRVAQDNLPEVEGRDSSDCVSVYSRSWMGSYLAP